MEAELSSPPNALLFTRVRIRNTRVRSGGGPPAIIACMMALSYRNEEEIANGGVGGDAVIFAAGVAMHGLHFTRRWMQGVYSQTAAVQLPKLQAGLALHGCLSLARHVSGQMCEEVRLLLQGQSPCFCLQEMLERMQDSHYSFVL
ncbi:hypothetical protein ACLOJK_035760 [Asimina triloba]